MTPTTTELADATERRVRYCAACLYPERTPDAVASGAATCVCDLRTGVPVARWLRPSELPHAWRMRNLYGALTALVDAADQGDPGSEHTDDDVADMLASVLPLRTILAAVSSHASTDPGEGDLTRSFAELVDQVATDAAEQLRTRGR